MGKDSGIDIRNLNDFKPHVDTKNGRALVIVSHRLMELSHLANRLIVLEKGKIINTTRDVVQGIKDYTIN